MTEWFANQQSFDFALISPIWGIHRNPEKWHIKDSVAAKKSENENEKSSCSRVRLHQCLL